jgi:hypothetical protein
MRRGGLTRRELLDWEQEQSKNQAEAAEKAAEREGQIRLAKWGCLSATLAALIAAIAPPLVSAFTAAWSERHVLSPEQSKQSNGVLKATTAIDSLGHYSTGGLSTDEAPVSDKLQLLIHGDVNEHVGASLVSPSGKTLIIRRFFVRLEAYAECPLRNGVEAVGAMGAILGKSFHISPDYNIYPVTFVSPDGKMLQQNFTGREVASYDFSLSFKKYVLYFLTFNVEYVDVSDGKARLLSSKPLPVITSSGEGGCLDIKSWWQPDMNQKPAHASYDSGLTPETYAYLTQDFRAASNSTEFSTELIKRVSESARDLPARVRRDPVMSVNLRRAQGKEPD